MGALYLSMLMGYGEVVISSDLEDTAIVMRDSKMV